MIDPVLIPFQKVINGHEYTVWGYPNVLLAKNISKLHEGYFLQTTVKENVTEIFWRSSHFFKRQLKYIGKVVYDISNDTMTYIKHCFRAELNESNNDNSIELCQTVINQLRNKDFLVIEEPTEKPKGKNIYKISVQKLLEYSPEGIEKQIIIPKSEFEQEWIKVRKKRKRKF